MAGKFTNTTYGRTVDNLVKATKGVLKNPYYVYTDKKPTKVTYYKQNLEKTTLDPDSGLNYAHIGEQSPIKFNKIEGFYLYGIDQITQNLDIGDFGLENDEISGQCIILPNTIEPTMGDYFRIPYLKEDILFRVNAVNDDTLDNGSNIYQIDYKLERVEDLKKIESQVVGTYKCIVNNIGTDFKCVIEDTSYQLIENLEGTMEDITAAYQIFFDSKVQNFIYLYNGFHMYDPYLIEFMIRNKLMSYGADYVYVHHGASLSKTFGYDYTKTLYYVLEHPEEIDTRTMFTTATAVGITDINSLMTTRQETYYQITYNDPNKINARIEIFPIEVIERCKSGELYKDTDIVEKQAYNLMIAYFKKDYDYIKGNLIDMLRQMDYTDNIQYFYLIPINLFIIKSFILHLMEK